jgi:hypothetical protein
MHGFQLFRVSTFSFFCESKWSAIPAKPNRCYDECRREYQTDPETGAAQISSGSEFWNRVSVEGKRFRRKSHQAVSEHFREMRRVERDLFEESNREQW